MKIVINNSCGSYGLSIPAVKKYAKLKDFLIYTYAYNPYYVPEIVPINEENNAPYHIYVFFTTPNKRIEFEEEDPDYFDINTIKRNDPVLIRIVEELKEKANGPYAKLKIVEIPDDVDWVISSTFDGHEIIEERHRIWS